MPLKPGKSKKVIGKNIAELSKGPHHKKMEAKFGAKKAQKIDVAIAFSKSRGASKKAAKK